MKKKDERFDLKKEYKKSWKYVKESKNFIYAIIISFFVFALIGFFVPTPDFISEQILNFIRELLEKTKDFSQFELIRFIFLNNVQNSFYGLIFGVFLGIPSILAALSNGYLLGFVSSMSVDNGGFISLWRLLPHGIFELPAIFISLGLGVKIGSFIFYKKKFEILKKYFFNSLRVFFLIIIPLFIIAAIIEGSLIYLLN